jgi:DHA1 family inner membrane transport protein
VRLFPHLPPRARHAFLHDLVGAVLFGIFSGVVVPFAAVVARRLGAPPLWISVLASAPALGFFLTAGWAPTLVASNPVGLVVWPAALARGLFLLTPWLPGPEALVAVVVGYHLLNGLTVPAYAETVGRVLPSELRGRLVGTVRVGMSVAAVGASLLAGPAIQRYGHGPVFAVASVFGVAGALVFSRIRLPRGSLHRTVAPPAWWTALRDRTFRSLLLATFVFGFGGWMMAPAVPLLLVDELRATSPQVGVLSAASSLASMVGFSVWGRYVDRRSGVAALRTLLTGAVATPLLFLVSFHPWFALLPFSADGFFVAGLDLAWMAACMELAPPGRVAAYAAAYTVLMGFRGITAPFVAGALASATGPRAVFLVAALLIGLAGFLARRHLRLPSAGAPSP